MRSRRKLIEVALPLDAINKASAREKSIRHGHPSTLHLWWARRPLAAARAVIFSQMVDDPSEYVDVLRSDAKRRRRAEAELRAKRKLWEEASAVAAKAEQAGIAAPAAGPEPTLDGILADHERQRLFKIIEDLVQWENTTNEEVLERARAEIWQSWRRACADNADHPRAKDLFDRHKLPAFHDPFAGGGALPLEAQRLGLEAYASDLNPVAVLINKAMIEIPPRFAGRPPVNPESRADRQLIAREWKGAQGLAEDVRYYGKWMRDEAEKRIGHLYPKIEVTAEMARERPDLAPYIGRSLTVIAWLWARTVPSPDPATAGAHVPLVASYWLCKKAGKFSWVRPIVDGPSRTWRFEVRTGEPPDRAIVDSGTKAGRGDFTCLLSKAPIPVEYVRAQGRARALSYRMLAIVVDTGRARLYLDANALHEAAAVVPQPPDVPTTDLPRAALGFRVQNYGYTTHASLFTPRQLTALDALAALVADARARVFEDARAAGLDAGSSLDDGGTGAAAYADAVAILLGIAVSRRHDRWTAFSIWHTIRENLESLIRLSAVPMTWEFAEGNPFSESTGNFLGGVDLTASAIESLGHGAPGRAEQRDARTIAADGAVVIAADPPYFDNVPYADLSDLFYVWLRRTLQPVLPDLMTTVLVPKSDELVADAARHGSRDAAERFFLDRMREVIERLRAHALHAVPLTIFYAFKQSESEEGGTVSTGWDTFLSALIDGGFSVVGTWPIRTEQTGGLRNVGRNSLATSVVLACRPREASAPAATRRELVSALKDELPNALARLQRGNIAPVDLAQAAIGPGMAIFTRYSKVLDAEGDALSVRDALALINQTLDEALAEQEGDFDADTRWALAWFEHVGFEEGEFGVAETLSKAKNTSVKGMVEAGIIASRPGRVRLLRPDELPEGWSPSSDSRLTVWEIVHQLMRALGSGGESAAAELVEPLGPRADVARELAYRLYTLAERRRWAADALAYNGLVQSWPEIARLAREASIPRAEQTTFFEGDRV